MEEKIRMQRIRMLSALGDFQLALSAADFMQEADEDQKYNHVELRRFRCYEHTAIVSYARPFSQSKGKTPKLSLKMCGVTLTPEEQELHDRVIDLRNKLVAHSDTEMMNFAAQAGEVMRHEGQPFYGLMVKHDEGLQFYKWMDQLDLIDLIRKVSFTLYDKMSELVQDDPKAFDIKVHFSDQSV
ncbi:hypothetical protein SAMN05421665_1242 [Yoonia rosea]|uniref:HEPN AbiU2-like domain-containing protein n=1 Tax=Yoonia rosea TaxID=287098 RepID=A0A1R3WUI5_9RHOB|nr:hypothetical protein [Yoonia rosea]SIT81257.1 hypothetical protein SAMN05421665_1242 [Yoonia rosea]